MSKDRLEEIKDKVSLLKNSSELQPHEFLVDILHLDWLIQQAEEKIQLEERIEKMEEELYELNESAIEIQNDFLNTNGEKNRLKERVKQLEQEIDGMTSHEEFRDNQYEKLYEENQRYKQALEFYANEINYQNFVELGKSNIEHDGGEKARQALEGGNENE